MRVVLMKINVKNINVGPLFKNNKKTVHLFNARRLEVALVFEHNDVGLKRLSNFV